MCFHHVGMPYYIVALAVVENLNPKLTVRGFEFNT